ncbi:hypothetical protein Nepgr_013908 [Nepenthes gracilis]|uniref:NADH:ubiquinone reductase (non-electrogenic) n=1 Tax=Nepenthes gracilis TaxID=150966 RepID=A0AAD3SJ69_NEPGR|nr:hypothetical protein Nepgr_013908 [Nepenthes gracilis]
MMSILKFRCSEFIYLTQSEKKMRGFSIFSKGSRLFNDYPSSSKFLVLFAVSTGGMVAFSEQQPGIGTKTIEAEKLENKKKRLVILGTGWAGISFMKDLDPSLYDVKVVSPRNYFTFTPLLPSVTCGTVEARSIVEPIRNIMRKSTGEFEFCEAECFKIDAANKKILCRTTFESSLVPQREFMLEYDYLIIAVGAQVNTFNTPGVVEHCHFLKEVEDAQKIRRTVIDCFEQASLPGLTKLYPSIQDLVKVTVIQSGDHILNTFDERICDFAEKKFSRDGIDVLTGCRVMSVSDDSIIMKVKSTGEVCSVPHGMVVWSTGVGTRPVTRDLMEQIGQSNRRILATNEWLRVKGCNDVFALGDCATVDQRKVVDDIGAIFEAADTDKSGTLTVKEFQDVVEDILVRYPQVELYLKSHHMQDVTDLLKDPEGNEREEVDIEGFKLALSHVDSQMKSLPATAQVAAQQGAYLAKCFNRMRDCTESPEGPRRFKGSGRHQFRPFRYKHLGQFAPLGGEQAAAELPGDWVSIGHSTQWLWYSVYASKQVSWRTRLLVVADWSRRFVFGRDSSRI